MLSHVLPNLRGFLCMAFRLGKSRNCPESHAIQDNKKNNQDFALIDHKVLSFINWMFGSEEQTGEALDLFFFNNCLKTDIRRFG